MSDFWIPQPNFLTEAGEKFFNAVLPAAVLADEVDERDSTVFASWCNICGFIEDARQAGVAPPRGYVAEARYCARAFGLAAWLAARWGSGSDAAAGGPGRA